MQQHMRSPLLVIILLVCTTLVASQIIPASPSWPATDVHIAIAGSQETWISYKQQMIFTLFAEYYKNDPSVAAWFYSLYDLADQTIYGWVYGPTSALTTCLHEKMNMSIVPPSITVVLGGPLVYSGDVVLNTKSLHNWTITYSEFGYDFFYETYPDRVPYAVYSSNYQTYFYFAAFENINEPPSFYSTPSGVTCFRFANSTP